MIKKVLICTITHSRPISLSRMLRSLQSQIVSDTVHVEICIVDNDCTGENKKVVGQFNNSPYRVHLIKEPQKGIVFARNAGVDFFLGLDFDALFFIDDDEWTKTESWIQNLIGAQNKSGADIVTGDVFTEPDGADISWTTNAMGRTQNRENLSETKKFYTGNLLVMKHVLERIKPAFDSRFAFTGSSDLHFSLRCRKHGFKAVYTDTAPVVEIFPRSRATIKWFYMRGFRNGSGAARSRMFETEGRCMKPRVAITGVARMIRGILTIFTSCCRKDKFVVGLMRFSSGIGTFAGLFGVSYKEYRKIHGK